MIGHYQKNNAAVNPASYQDAFAGACACVQLALWSWRAPAKYLVWPQYIIFPLNQKASKQPGHQRNLRGCPSQMITSRKRQRARRQDTTRYDRYDMSNAKTHLVHHKRVNIWTIRGSKARVRVSA